MVSQELQPSGEGMPEFADVREARNLWRSFFKDFDNEGQRRDPEARLLEIQQLPPKEQAQALEIFFKNVSPEHGAYTHPFVGELAQAVLPEYVRYAASITVQLALTRKGSRSCSEDIKTAALFDSDKTIKELRRLPYAPLKGDIMYGLREAASRNPHVLLALQRLWPVFNYHEMAIPVPAGGLSEEEAYKWALHEAGERDPEGRDRFLYRLFCTCRDRLHKEECNPTTMGLLQFLKERGMLKPDNPEIRFLWRMYKERMKKEQRDQLYRTGKSNTLVDTKKLQEVLSQEAVADKEEEDGPKPPERMSQQSKEYQWIRSQLSFWSAPLRDAVLKTLPQSQEKLQSLKKTLENHLAVPARKTSGQIRHSADLKLLDSEQTRAPITAAVFTDSLYLRDMTACVPTRDSSASELREGWYAAILHKMCPNEKIEYGAIRELCGRLWKAHDFMQKSRGNYYKRETAETITSLERRALAIICGINKFDMSFSKMEKVNGEMVQQLLDVIRLGKNDGVYFSALELLTPTQLKEELKASRPGEMNLSYIGRRMLAEYVYRFAEQLPVSAAATLIQKFSHAMQGIVRSRETSGEEDPTETTAAGFFAPNVFKRAVARGAIRRSVPIAPEQKKELIAWAKKTFEAATDHSAISPIGYVRRVVQREVKEWAPVVGVGGGALVVLGGLVAGGAFVLHKVFDNPIASRPDDPPHIPPDESLQKQDRLVPHAPEVEQREEVRTLLLSKELKGRDRYLVTGLFGIEDPFEFRQRNLEDTSMGRHFGDLLSSEKLRTSLLPPEENETISITIPHLREEEVIPLPAGASPIKTGDDTEASLTLGFSTPGILKSRHNYKQGTVTFNLPKKDATPDRKVTPSDVRESMPELSAAERYVQRPKLPLENLESVAPALGQAVREAQGMSAYDAAEHLEKAVHNFLQYQPVQAYEDLGKDGRMDPLGKHEYLELILSLQKGECAQAARLLQELFAHVGLPSVTVDCVVAEGKKVPLYPGHVAVGTPMRDSTGNMYLEIFDGTPTGSLNSAPEPEDSEVPASVIGTISDTITKTSGLLPSRAQMLILVALLAAGGAGAWWALRRRKKASKDHVSDEIVTTEHEPPTIEVQLTVPVPPSRKPESELPVVAVPAVPVPEPPPFRIKEYAKWDASTVRSLHNLQISNQLSFLTPANMPEIEDKLQLLTEASSLPFAEAAKDIQTGLDAYTKRAFQALQPVLHAVPEHERYHLCEATALWMHNIVTKPAFAKAWLESLPKRELDDVQEQLVHQLLEPLLHGEANQDDETPAVREELLARIKNPAPVDTRNSARSWQKVAGVMELVAPQEA